MTMWIHVWLWLSVLIGVAWGSRHAALTHARRTNRRLGSRSYPALGPDAPRVSVLVAAKDEEANIEVCLRTLLDQDYPNYEIIAIDDRSRDGTAAIMDRLAAAHPERLRAIHVTSLPPGWYGKNHAMHVGISRATGEWLCLLDADCRQTSRATLSVAVQEAAANRIDLLSVLPVLETRNFWEKVIQPVCAAIMILWFNPTQVNDPRSKVAYANGAFILMRRETYAAIGGHKRVRAEGNEDMHLARLTKESGRRLYVIQNDDLYVTRMYSTLREAWRGWSRIFYGCFGTARRILATLAVLLVMSFLPFVTLAVAVPATLLSTGPAAEHWTYLAAVAAAVVVILESVIYRFMRLMQATPWSWLTYSLGVIIGIGMLCSALRKRFGGTMTWRGTTYATGAGGTDSEPGAPTGGDGEERGSVVVTPAGGAARDIA